MYLFSAYKLNLFTSSNLFFSFERVFSFSFPLYFFPSYSTLPACLTLLFLKLQNCKKLLHFSNLLLCSPLFYLETLSLFILFRWLVSFSLCSTGLLLSYISVYRTSEIRQKKKVLFVLLCKKRNCCSSHHSVWWLQMMCSLCRGNVKSSLLSYFYLLLSPILPLFPALWFCIFALLFRLAICFPAR